MKTEEQIRKNVLKETIGDVLGLLGSDLEIAHKTDNPLQMEWFAHKINEINDVVNMMIETDKWAEEEGAS